MKMFQTQYRKILPLVVGISVFIIFEQLALILGGSKLNITLTSLFYVLDIGFFLISILTLLPRINFRQSPLYVAAFKVIMILCGYTMVVCLVGMIYINSTSTSTGFIGIRRQSIFLSLLRGSYVFTFALVYYTVKENLWRIKRESILVQEKAIAERRRNELEIARLKSQINPHLISNGLGFIYQGLVTGTDPKKITDTVLLLSEMSDYSLSSDRQSDAVTLKEDIDNVERFIRFQQLLSNDNLILIYENSIEPADMGQLIPPLLFFNFIENVFKHGDLEDPLEKTKISIKREGRQIHLRTKNSCLTSPILKSNGIGHENTKKLLDYHYPNSHNLSITVTDRVYQVDLFITLWN